MFAHIHVYYNSVKSTDFWHTVILFFFGKNTTYFSYMQEKWGKNAIPYPFYYMGEEKKQLE